MFKETDERYSPSVFLVNGDRRNLRHVCRHWALALIGTGRAGTEVAPFSLRMKGRATGNQSILRDLRFFRAATKPSRAGRGPERPHV